MNALPPEKRRAYLLTPKTFLTMESLTKAVLAADGVTEEMLQEQETKLKLIDQFLQAKDEAALKELVAAHDPQLDYNFFEILILLFFLMGIGMLAFAFFGILSSIANIDFLDNGGANPETFKGIKFIFVFAK